jgi:hypothetical protein
MKSLRRALAVLLALGGCQPHMLGKTGVRVDLTADPIVPQPWHYQVVWLEGAGPGRTFDVPESGRLSVGAPAILLVEVEPALAGPRRLVARGMRDHAVVSLGAARVTAAPDVWVGVTVVTTLPDQVSDGDRDGWPDTVDLCPRTADPCPQDATAAHDATTAHDATAD